MCFDNTRYGEACLEWVSSSIQISVVIILVLGLDVHGCGVDVAFSSYPYALGFASKYPPENTQTIDHRSYTGFLIVFLSFLSCVV